MKQKKPPNSTSNELQNTSTIGRVSMPITAWCQWKFNDIKKHIKLFLNQWNPIDHLIYIEINLIAYLYIYNISYSWDYILKKVYLYTI